MSSESNETILIHISRVILAISPGNRIPALQFYLKAIMPTCLTLNLNLIFTGDRMLQMHALRIITHFIYVMCILVSKSKKEQL